jgi:hypothetical protein
MARHDESEATAVATQLLGRLYPRVADVPATLDAFPDSSLQEGSLAYRVRTLAASDSPSQWVLCAHVT